MKIQILEINRGKTLAELHCEYEDQKRTAGRPSASYQMHRNVFNFEFNIAFFTPKKDQSEDCAEFNNAEGEEKVNLKEKYQRHFMEKDLSRNEKENDKI